MAGPRHALAAAGLAPVSPMKRAAPAGMIAQTTSLQPFPARSQSTDAVTAET